MEGQISIPGKTIDPYVSTESVSSIKITKGNPVFEVEIYIDGRLKIIPTNMSTIWSNATTTQKDTIRTFLKLAGVEAINLWHAAQDDGVVTDSNDYTGDIIADPV